MMRPALIAAMAAVLCNPSGTEGAWARAQVSAGDLTGTWEVRGVTRGRGGTPEVLTLVQHDDGSLSGAFIVLSSGKAERIADGSIEGAAFSFTRQLAGRRYQGTIDGDRLEGTMTYTSGTREIREQFSGTRTSTEVIAFEPDTETPKADPEAPAAAETPAQAGVAAVAVTPGNPGANQAILTIDGEVLSFAMQECAILFHPSLPDDKRWNGRGGADREIISFEFRPSGDFRDGRMTQDARVYAAGRGQFMATYDQMADGTWMRRVPVETMVGFERVPANGPVVTIESSGLTARGIFHHNADGSEHTIELKVICEFE